MQGDLTDISMSFHSSGVVQEFLVKQLTSMQGSLEMIQLVRFTFCKLVETWVWVVAQ